MIRLSDIDTRAPQHLDKTSCKCERVKFASEIGQLQNQLYADGNHSVLVVFQGMDASGKDGTTRKIFANCSPTGVWAYAFKKPSEEEMDHDFLWRVHKRAPRKGMIQVFNRSHYEDILIQRVHNWIDEERVQARMSAINAFERLIQIDNNTLILKFYLHLSRDRQKQKLQERIDVSEKQWKHNPNDWKEAEHWDDYMNAYQDVLNWSEIPWHVVPADQKWYRDYYVAKTVKEALEGLDLSYPSIEPNPSY